MGGVKMVSTPFGEYEIVRSKRGCKTISEINHLAQHCFMNNLLITKVKVKDEFLRDSGMSILDIQLMEECLE